MTFIWLRECLADFCDGLDETHSVEIKISDPADRTVLMIDKELMTRALDNLLVNSVRHNPFGCLIRVFAEIYDGRFKLFVQDNGAGYPEAVLDILHGLEENENSPHVLGLHLVQQIASAHNGAVHFFNNRGAVSEITM